MAGIAGWFTNHSNPQLTAATESFASELNRFDASKSKIFQQPSCMLASAELINAPETITIGNNTIVIHGTPRKNGSKLSATNCLNEYSQNGKSFLATLTGPFSLAIINPNERKLLVAIDRLGIMPMYFAQIDGGIAFASTINAFHHIPNLKLDLNQQAIFHFLFNHIIPSPHSIYQEIFKLEPATYFEFSDGKFNKQCYWHIHYTHEKGKIDFGSLKNEFVEAIRSGVKDDIEGIQEAGSFLSGGTDSSTVSGMLGKITQAPAKTYSIGFDQQGFDESEYARIAAKHFQTNHHEYYVTPNDVLEVIQKIPQVYGEPFGNSSAVPAYFCAKLARSDGIRKILGGDGGDELFGGNERYATQKIFAIYGGIPAFLRNKMLNPITKFPFGNAIMPIRKLRSYIDQASMPMPKRLQSYNYLYRLGYENILSKDFLRSVNVDAPMDEMTDVYNSSNARTMMNKMQTLDMKYTLADNDIPKVSKMCELAGVEVGYPLLHQSMIDVSAKLPIDQKVKGFKLRYFFKEALRDFLPIEIINKPKHGFGLPFGDWMVKDPKLNEFARDQINDFRRRGIANEAFVSDLMDKKMTEHAKYYGGITWLFVILELWLKTNRKD